MYFHSQVADYRHDTGLMRNEERVIFYDDNEGEKEVSGACAQDCEVCSSGSDVNNGANQGTDDTTCPVQEECTSCSVEDLKDMGGWQIAVIAIILLVVVIVGVILGYVCGRKRSNKKGRFYRSCYFCFLIIVSNEDRYKNLRSGLHQHPIIRAVELTWIFPGAPLSFSMGLPDISRVTWRLWKMCQKAACFQKYQSDQGATGWRCNWFSWFRSSCFIPKAPLLSHLHWATPHTMNVSLRRQAMGRLSHPRQLVQSQSNPDRKGLCALW